MILQVKWVLGKLPKWMVYNGKPYFLMDDLGGFTPLFLETPKWPFWKSPRFRLCFAHSEVGGFCFFLGAAQIQTRGAVHGGPGWPLDVAVGLKNTWLV